ncbi:MAG: Hsp20/alpha crystallin family protein [Propionivibrio sp.]|jgi:HSP20 family protein|nr:Hsp20/alpha crystallin family protein [Propionivibrio sp.]
MSENSTVTKTTDLSRDEPALLPPTDVVEDAGGITLYADLPGVPKDKLTLQVEADTLTIEGTVSLDLPEGMESSHAEVSLPHYRRVFTLSRELDPGKVSAEFNQGVLKLRIPKAEHAQPRRIEIQVA